MSTNEYPGTFLTGGTLPPPKSTANLPSPDDVAKGSIYRDEVGDLWRRDLVLKPDNKRVPSWTPVTPVSARQHKRDQLLAFVFFIAAFVGAGLIYLVARAADFGAYGVTAIVVVFFGFAWAAYCASLRASRQVVLTEAQADIDLAARTNRVQH